MSLVDRAKNIILTPKTEWQAIAAETPNTQQIILGYVVPLALIPAVASILGGLLFTHSMALGLTFSLAMAVGTFIVAIVGVLVTAFVVDFLAPNFGSEKNFGRSVQLVAYAYTPAWIAGILNIIPFLGVLAMLAGLYGIYIMFLGFPAIKKTPEDKVVVYLVVTIIVLLLAWIVLGAIMAAIVTAVVGVGMLSTGAAGL